MKNLLILLVLLVIGLELLKITIINSLSIQGVDYTSLLSQTKALHNENMTLHDTLLLDSSYHTIEQKARKEGFKQASFMDLQNSQQ